MTQPKPPALTTSEMIYHALKRDIIHGVYPSGQKLKLETIKERYHVSYSPLREALSRLAESRLLISSGQRGFQVPDMSVHLFQDITNTRIKLECTTLEMAMTHGDTEWESRVVAAYHLLSQQEKRVHDQGDTSETARDALDSVHDGFHQALLSGSQSNWMLFFVQSLNAQFDRYRRYSKTFQLTQQTSVAHHLKLKDLALERSINEAVATLEEHIRHSANAITQDYLTKLRSEQTLSGASPTHRNKYDENTN